MAHAAATEMKVDNLDQSIEDIHKELRDECKLSVWSGNDMERKIDESVQRMEGQEKKNEYSNILILL